MKPRLIIAGAGVAGLYAATELATAYDITVIEATNEAGGRIKSIRNTGNSGIIEAGAEFVHGNLPLTRKIATEAGLHIVKMEGKMLRKEGNTWTEQKEMIEGWDELVKKMKQQHEDITMQDFLDKNFSDDRYTDLRRHIKLFVQGFDLADPGKASVQSLYREWSAEEEQFRLREGYGELVSHLVKKAVSFGCKFHYGDAVRQVDWQNNDVSVYTNSGRRFSADKMLITLPVSVIRSVASHMSVNFTPPIDDYIRAFHDIGFGTVIKVVFDFKTRFWSSDAGFFLSDEMIPTWWTHSPLENNLLTGWAGGPVAERISQHTDLELKEIALNSLSRIFNVSISELKNNVKENYVFNWLSQENAMGAYSYSTPRSKAARELLNTPLANTVFFAGEGLFEGEYPGTVEAALKSSENCISALNGAMK